MGPSSSKMFCQISGQTPEDPVVTAKSGFLFERRLIEKYIDSTGKCPVSGEELSADDLISTKASHEHSGNARAFPKRVGRPHARNLHAQTTFGDGSTGVVSFALSARRCLPCDCSAHQGARWCTPVAHHSSGRHRPHCSSCIGNGNDEQSAGITE